MRAVYWAARGIRRFCSSRHGFAGTAIDARERPPKGFEGFRYKPIFGKPETDIWALLIEKAFAKMIGSYPRLDGGHMLNAFRALTGCEEQEMWRLACESIVDLQRGLWPQAVANPHVQPRWRLSHRKRAEDSHHAPAAESKPTAANFHLVLKVGAAVEAIREEGGDEWEPATVSAIEDETVSLMFADRFRIWQVPFQRVRTPASATC